MHHDQAMKIVKEFSEEWMEAYNSGNANAVAALYTENGIFSNGTVGIVKGRDNIEEAMAALIARGVRIEVATKDVTCLNDDHFIGAGHLTAFGPDGRTAFRGNWGATYVKNREEWHAVLHVANVTLPA